MMNLDRLMNDANRALSEGRFADAERACDAIVSALPTNVAALVLAGVIRAQQKRHDQADVFFERAVAADPRSAPASLWLSMSLLPLGRASEALEAAQRSIALNPADLMARHQVGRCLVELGEYSKAEPILREVATAVPKVAIVQQSLGMALYGLKRNAEAIKALHRSALLEESASTFELLSRIQLEEKDVYGAIDSARGVVRLQPDSSVANAWLARVLLEGSHATEAAEYAERAVLLDPDSGSAQLLLGTVFQVQGKLREAGEHFRLSIAALPNQGAAYLSLVTNQKITEADRPLVERMEAQLSDDKLCGRDRIDLEFALGKAWENLGDSRRAMGHYDRANSLDYALKFGAVKFDQKAAALETAQVIQRFDASFIGRNVRASDSDVPIFVVGMIRSGTTLVEQILSSHPNVGAAGEQSFWLENSNALLSGGELNARVADKFAERYVRLLQDIDPGKAHVVDKMPMNYMILGLIHCVLPKAKIIHIKRNPIDTCLSIYTTPNRARLGWGGDKDNIAFNYRQYLALMAHWREVLPEDSLLEISYEDLVTNPEIETRRMVEFCGLPWEDALLRPQDNERTVVTPSVWQVRQPIYRTSMARSERFKDLLGPFSELTK
ncbi:tetratricopeptide repeat protein [soil metagenome]